jgi:hypothetical protein
MPTTRNQWFRRLPGISSVQIEAIAVTDATEFATEWRVPTTKESVPRRPAAAPLVFLVGGSTRARGVPSDHDDACRVPNQNSGVVIGNFIITCQQV